MKQWTVYFRDKNGSKASVVIEAEDRAGVFAELKKRGISAISVTEGASNKKPRKVAKNSALSKGRGLIAAAIVVVAGAVAWWMMMGEEKKVEEVAANGKVRVEKEVCQKRINGDVKAVRSNVDNRKDDGKSGEKQQKAVIEEKWLGLPVVRKTVVTNGNFVIATYYTNDGKSHVHYQDMRDKALPSGVDQILAIMTQEDAGVGAPPLPLMNDFENEIAAALKKDIIIEDSDSAEVRAMKERVISARKELTALMAQGVSVGEIIKDYNRMQEDNAQVRFEAVKDVQKALESGDRKFAQEMCEKYNQILEKMGLMKIEIPEEE